MIRLETFLGDMLAEESPMTCHAYIQRNPEQSARHMCKSCMGCGYQDGCPVLMAILSSMNLEVEKFIELSTTSDSFSIENLPIVSYAPDDDDVKSEGGVN